MTPEQYKALEPKEKAMYDELNAFSKRLTERMEEIIELLKRILSADADGGIKP